MQNYTGWTMGSNFEKARGSNAKNRTKLQFLLNRLGLRVDFKRVQGLFRKSARRRGMFRSNLLNLDPAAQI